MQYDVPSTEEAAARAAVERSPWPAALRPLRTLSRWALGRMSALDVSTKLGALLLLGLCLPMLMVLFLLSEGRVETAEIFAVLTLVAALILLVPLARLMGWVVVLHDLRQVNRLCLAVRSGDYAQDIPLPPEGEDEHEVLRLKRNLNWMVHAIATRERWLRCRLDESVQAGRMYEEMSQVDDLTGVYNRRFFEARLAEAAERSRRLGTRFHLVLIDCDGFKAVNDTMGHQAGDDLLRNLGRILRLSLRESEDVPFRYGGDEFGVIFACADIGRVVAVAERIRERFKDIRLGETTLSVGIARFDPSGTPEESLRRVKERADQALYEAKSRGKDQVAVAGD